MRKDVVSILLPALNEEEMIGRVIDAIPRDGFRARGYELDIMVVDGHSTDRTQEIALEKGARLITQDGRGKGNAVKSAFREFDGRYLFMLDADGTYPPQYIEDIWPLLEEDAFDIVLGSRLTGRIAPGAMTRFNYIGNKFLTTTANILFPNGHKATDVCTGLWGFQGDVVKDLNPKLNANEFDIEAEMYAKCVKRGYRIAEVPIMYNRRGGPTKLGALKDGVKIFARLIKEKFED